MPKFVITELDQTTPGTNADSNEVVYIPGCVDATLSELHTLNDNGVREYVGLELNVPTLFTNVSDFEAVCGKSGLKFEKDWDYRNLTYKNSDGKIVTAFEEAAVPYHSIMFKKGVVDPAYIMAKELLAAGLSVMYERINGDFEYTEVNTSELVDFETNYSKYFTKIARIAPIKDAVAPTQFSGRNLYQWGTSSTGSSDPILVPSDMLIETSILSNINVKVGDVYDDAVTYYIIEGRNETPVSGEDLESNGVIEKKSSTSQKSFKTDKYKSQQLYTKEYVECKVLNTGSQPKIAAADILGETFVEGVRYTYVGNLSYTALTEAPKDWNTAYWKGDLYFEILGSVSTSDYNAPYCAVPSSTYSGVVYDLVRGVQLDKVYEALDEVYGEDSKGLSDIGSYNIKYITSGGYPVHEYGGNSLRDKMLALAASRGDCYALIDHTDNLGRTLDISKKESLFKSVSSAVTNGEYGAMFTPWAEYTRTTSDSDKNAPLTMRMPASYAYLQSLAQSLKTNAPWMAIAGAARGSVKYLADGGMTTIISNGVADAMLPRQGTCINSITSIKPYGQVIWGNRTLKFNEDNLIATSFLNIRNLLCDVKKVAYRTARALAFEQDNEVLWINFKSRIAPTLDKMLSGYGLSGYKIIRNTEHEKAREKATVCARIILYPVYAVEDFYIDIILKDDEATFESYALVEENR